MISYYALFDELEKIAEEDQRQDVTKERLKRALIVAGASGAGTGLGYGAGKLFERAAGPHITRLGKQLPRSAVRKYGPAVVGGLAAGATALTALHRRKADQYVDEGERPK